MEDKFKIKVNIGERNYSLWVRRGDTKQEETVRKAGELINESLSNYKNKGGGKMDSTDFLAMTALQFAVEALECEGKENVEPLITELKKLNFELEEAIK